MKPEARLRYRLRSLFRRIRVSLSPNRSSRYGAPVRGAMIHTTESSDHSLQAIVDYFSRRSTQASSHYVVGALAPKGSQWTEVVLVVPEKEKAWTSRSANPYFVQYELIGRAARTRQEWLGKYRTQLETVAALVAEDSLQYGFPVKRDYPGIIGHGDAAREGFPNDHTDPGPGFPWDVFLDSVKRYKKLAVAPPPKSVSRGPGSYRAA